MANRIVDLSVPLMHQSASEPMPASIRYVDHREGQQQMQTFLGVEPEDLVYSAGLGWAIEEVQAITHTSTHIDAPYHYGPESEGLPAKTIDQLPLEWFLQPGVVLDMSHKNDGEAIEIADIEDELQRIDYSIEPLNIVLIRTGADQRLETAEYFQQPGLTRESTLWLVEQGVKVIGIDAYTLDRPFAAMMKDYQASGDGKHIWPAHFAGITREYCQIEKLANLHKLPPHGFQVSCLPVNIQSASAAWCRAIAIVADE